MNEGVSRHQGDGKHPSHFPTTHWSVVINAGAGSESQARSALETLCRQYWYPLYAFVRRQGRPHHEAEDCSQEFLARLLASEGISHAQPERGRFRSFLLVALRNFLTTEWHRARAVKRGGGQRLLTLELDDADARFARDVAATSLSPEQVFDRNWALGMLDRALATLRGEYEQSGRGALFAALSPLMLDDAPSMAEAAAPLGRTAHAFTVALHRFRRRLAERLRADVAETVATDADIDDELRHLITAVDNVRAR
jgi:DNA-directed RNA polymerase specialized sigma24 family protein